MDTSPPRLTQEQADLHHGTEDVPSFEELSHMKETENLFSTSLFRLQMEELLSEVRVDFTKTTVIEHLLHALDDEFQCLEEEQVAFDTKKKSKKAAAHSWTLISQEELRRMGPLKLSKPENIHLVGSFLLKTVCKPKLNVDVLVELPKGFIRNKDVKNHRYAFKRELYLQYLADHLKHTRLFSHVSKVTSRGDSRKPILEIVPSHVAVNAATGRPLGTDRDAGGDSEAHPRPEQVLMVKTPFVIRVAATVAPGFWSPTRLSPLAVNLEGIPGDQSPFALAQYNNSIAEDMWMEEHARMIHRATLQVPVLLDALVLLKCWAGQRGYISLHSSSVPRQSACVLPSREDSKRNSGTFNGFLLSMLCVRLVRDRVITRHMSPYQAFSSVIKYIAEGGLQQERDPQEYLSYQQQVKACDPLVPVKGEHKVSLAPVHRKKAGMETQDQRELGEMFRQAGYSSVFLVCQRQEKGSPRASFTKLPPLNLFSSVSKAVLTDVRVEAATSVALLSDTSDPVGSFHSLFLERIPFFLKYDYYVYVEEKDQQIPAQSTAMAERVAIVLSKALNNRITAIGQWGHSNSSFAVFGLSLDKDNWKRMVDTGETTGLRSSCSLTEKQASHALRQFWGELGHLRRFKDGQVTMSVVWEGVRPRECIPEAVVRAALALHPPLPPTSISSEHNQPSSLPSYEVGYAGRQLDQLLVPPAHLSDARSTGPCSPGNSNNHEVECSRVFRRLDRATLSLEKLLEGMEGLPLKVVEFTGISAAHRHTSVYAPPYRPSLDHTAEHSPVSPSGGAPQHKQKKARTSRGKKEKEERGLERVEPLPVVVCLEDSPAWPIQLAPLRKLKAAMYVRIARGFTARAVQAHATHTYTDVALYGYLFRIILYVRKEVQSLGALARQPPSFIKDRSSLRQQARELRKVGQYMVIHTKMIKTFGERHPGYALTVRLASLWLARHMYSFYVAQETVELLVARVFSRPGAFVAPVSHFAGFMRFLHLLATYPWETSALAVDLQEPVSKQQLDKANEFYVAMVNKAAETPKSQHFRPSMFLVTPYDPTKSIWTRDKPPLVVVDKMAKEATLALEEMHARLADPSRAMHHLRATWQFPFSFDTSIADNADASLLLFPQYALHKVPNHLLRGTHIRRVGGLLPLPCPVRQLLDQVETMIGTDVCLFLYDQLKPEKVYLVWNPAIFSPAQFSLFECGNSIPVVPQGEGPRVVPNVDEYLLLVERTGQSIVASIES